MKWFRETLQHNRIFVLSLISVSLFAMMDLRNYVYAYQDWEAKEKRLQEISEFLDIPVDELRPDHETVYERVQDLFGIEQEDPVKAAGMKRLQEVLRKHEEQLAANPYLPQIEKVKREHAPSRIEGLVRDVLQLSRPKNGKALPEGSQKALLRGLHYGLKESLELPIDENLPAKAQRKHAEFQAGLNRIMGQVQRVVDETQQEKMVGTVGQKVSELQRLAADGLERKTRRARYLDRGLPNQRVEKTAARKQVTASELNVRPAKMQASTPLKSVRKDAVHPDIQALAEELKFIPAKIFSWAHDNLEVDPKWGATKSPRGTLKEGLGTAWDQAWLLQQLLIASGVDARLEWGQVQISLDQLQDLTGVEDPWQAGDMMTTGGTPFVLLTQAGQPVAARMDHVWVKAHIDNVPFRGAEKHVAGDTWMRMDPTLKIYNETDGIQLYDKVPFTLENYLLSGTTESPRRVYEDAMWQYIRDNGIQCATLEQVKKVRTIKKEAFPFVPGTLRAKAVRIDGESQAMPAAFQYKIALDVRDTTGNSLLSWSAPWPEIYGKRLELAWPGATADDQAVLDAEGGVFETPPYLVDLKPTLRLNSTVLKTGSAIGSAADIEIYGTLTPPAGDVTDVLFQGQAGERNVFAVDLGTLPQSRLAELQATLNANTAAGNVDATEAATLALIGASYMNILSRDIEDLAAWKWQRVLELGTFGTVIQAGDVQTTVSGSPLSFSKGPLVTDVATMPLGFFHIDGKQNFGVETFELVGSQSSYLEGTALDMVVPDETMTAVTFLTRAVRNGQQLHKITGANADTVLAGVELADAVEQEIRSAVGQGKIAWVSDRELQINQWRGSGYVIQDPETGAAGYLGTGGYGVGSGTGGGLPRIGGLGSEDWMSTTDGFLASVFELFGWPMDGISLIFGDPVNLSNGNMWTSRSDLVLIARGLPLVWNRTYNSQSSASGPLGKGWTFSFGESLRVLPDGSVVYEEEDGTEHVFFLSEGGGFVAPKGKRLELTKNIDGFLLAYEDGLVQRFDPKGLLKSLSDRYGNSISLTRDQEGNLRHIHDAAGRQVLSFESQDGKISRVVDLIGRAIEYTYVGELLVAVQDLEGESWGYHYDEGGRLVGIVDPLSNSDTFTYDGAGRMIRHVDSLGQPEEIAYGRSDFESVVTDKGGRSSLVAFDSGGRPTIGVDPLGIRKSAVWNDDNRWIEITGSQGKSSRRTYDSRGNVLSETDMAGHTVEVTYDSKFNQITSYMDSSGTIFSQKIDEHGNIESRSKTVEGQLVVEKFAYDEFGQLSEHIDGLGASTKFYYGVNGVMSRRLDAMGNETLMQSNDIGSIEKVTDADGNFARATYSAGLHLESVIDWHGDTASYRYDSLGRPVEISGPSMGSRKMAYDELGRLVKTTDPLGHSRKYEYAPSGNVLSVTDENGNITGYFYDGLDRLIATVDPAGFVWILDYCHDDGMNDRGCTPGPSCASSFSGENQFCEVTDPQGNTVKRTFDDRGFPIKITDAEGNSTIFEYDSLGRRTSMVDPRGFRTSFSFDEDSRLISVSEPHDVETTYEYDAAGNRIRTIDAEERVWSQEFDALNRLWKKTDPLGNLTILHYDPLGNKTGWTDARGSRVKFEFEVNRPIRVSGFQEEFSRYIYEEGGRALTVENADTSWALTFDLLSRPTRAENKTLGKALEYSYDAAGNLTEVLGPKGRVIHSYDSRNLRVETEDPALGLFKFGYDASGRRIKTSYPNGVSSEDSFDRNGRLTSRVVFGVDGEVIGGHRYSYDEVGNRTEHASLNTSVIDRYQYDGLNRLTRWWNTEGSFENFTYDKVGNRTKVESSNGSIDYEYNSGNRLISSFQYGLGGETTVTNFVWDQNGNLSQAESSSLIKTYRYDEMNRLIGYETSSGTKLNPSYGPLGERSGVEKQGRTSRFLMDPFGSGRFPHLMASYSDEDKEEYHAFGTNIDEPLGSASPDGLRYLHQDGLGSITQISDSSGQMTGAASYAPFGTGSNSGSAMGPFSFTGRHQDTSDLSYYRARYYEPEIGRFLTQDSWPGELERPSSQNKYTYVENNPVNFTDPSGRIAVNRVAALAFFAIGMSGIAGFYISIWPDLKPWFTGTQAVYPNSLSRLLDTIGFLFSLGVAFVLGYFNYINFVIGWTLMFKSKGWNKVHLQMKNNKSWLVYTALMKNFGGSLHYGYAGAFATCSSGVYAATASQAAVAPRVSIMATSFKLCMNFISIIFR